MSVTELQYQRTMLTNVNWSLSPCWRSCVISQNLFWRKTFNRCRGTWIFLNHDT